MRVPFDEFHFDEYSFEFLLIIWVFLLMNSFLIIWVFLFNEFLYTFFFMSVAISTMMSILFTVLYVALEEVGQTNLILWHQLHHLRRATPESETIPEENEIQASKFASHRWQWWVRLVAMTPLSVHQVWYWEEASNTPSMTWYTHSGGWWNSINQVFLVVSIRKSLEGNRIHDSLVIDELVTFVIGEGVQLIVFRVPDNLVAFDDLGLAWFQEWLLYFI